MSKVSKLEGAINKIGDAALASADARFEAVDTLIGKASRLTSVDLNSSQPISTDMVSSELVSTPNVQVAGASDTKPTDTTSNDIKSYPWKDANAKVKVAFQLRLPESLHMKLKWLSEQGRDSIHEIALRGVEVEVDKLLGNIK